MLYHGIDLIEIDRITCAVSRWGNRFLQRVFTWDEQCDCGGSYRSLAARWAAKEATAKALGVGLRGIGSHGTGEAQAVSWLDIHVVRTATGQPTLHLHGTAAIRAATLGWTTTVLSLSHTSELAIASVVAMSVPPEQNR